MNNVETIRLKELDPDIIPPSTADCKKPDQGSAKIVVIGKPGCFLKGTPVLMHNGQIKPVEDVQVGDLVMGPDSQPRQVLELCRNRDEMFQVLPKTGDAYTVNQGHKLVLRHRVTGTVKEMSVAKFLLSKQTDWQIFRAKVDFPSKTVDEPHIVGRNLTTTIPDEYKINDYMTRSDVLAGFLSNHGQVLDGYRLVKTTEMVPSLQADILFLARSLGLDAYRTASNLVIGEGDLHVDFTLVSKGIDDYYGFTVTGDHRFLLASFDVVRNTGKSTLIGSLLYAKKHIFPVALAFSGTEESNHFYCSIIPSTFVFNNYEEEQIIKTIRRQKIAKEHLDVPWAIMVLDDCTDDPAIFRKPLQQGLYKRGRHWKLLYILSLQYAMDIRPGIRTNVDGVFILREPNLRNRRVIYENYAGIIPDFKLFCDIMDQVTDDYTALYVHNSTKTNDWKDCVFWYKAKPVPSDFRFGSREYWDFHYARYNPDYVDPII